MISSDLLSRFAFGSLLVAGVGAVAASAAVAPSVRSADPCEQRRHAASADLYCVPLVAVSAVPEAAGEARLRPPPGPFGVGVAPDGTMEYEVVLAIEGLPDPKRFGPYATYVAWVTTPVLDPLVKLGEVGNGTTRTGRIAMDRFLVMVSAEPSADVERRTGPLVLRGLSPATRMRPHDWPAIFASLLPDDGDEPPSRAPASTADRWLVPPMHEALPMVPGMQRLRPSTGPWLPPQDPASLPEARPSEIVDLADGDSLHLVATPVAKTVRGRTFVLYGFDGRVPGPMIRVEQGARITVGFENATDWPATIHWHGIRLENRFDGVPGVTQEPVPPGGTFRYEIVFPDAGIYWYHPHHREDVLQDLGLYGNLLVRPERSPWGPVHGEEALVLDDLLLAESGLVPWGSDAATHAMMGRFGNVMLVNGEPDWSARVRTGELLRLYLTNVSNTRTFNLALDGARMKAVGGDLGPFERETPVDNVVIAPAERYVVDVLFDRPGRVPLVSRVQGIDHGYGTFFEQVDTLGVVEVTGEPAEPDLGDSFGTLREDPVLAEELEAYRPHFDRPVDGTIELGIEVDGLPFPVGVLMRMDAVYFHPIEWAGTMPMMNWATTSKEVRWVLRDPATGKENMEIDWSFREGDVAKIRLVNDREAFHAMQHPIHLHGQRFLVLARDGVPNENLVWKDTLLLPTGGTAEILVDFSNPGDWMLHCHIAEHLETGMKTVIEVTP